MPELDSTAARRHVVSAADRKAREEQSFRHPLNPRSELHAYQLAEWVGLQRTAVMLARIPPKRESFMPHVHAVEEEWLFVLQGRGVVDIGAESFELAAGDFVGFPPGGAVHHLRNPYAEDLVYLCGGEREPVDVVDYPTASRRAVRVGHCVTVYPADAGDSLAIEAVYEARR